MGVKLKVTKTTLEHLANIMFPGGLKGVPPFKIIPDFFLSNSKQKIQPTVGVGIPAVILFQIFFQMRNFFISYPRIMGTQIKTRLQPLDTIVP